MILYLLGKLIGRFGQRVSSLTRQKYDGHPGGRNFKLRAYQGAVFVSIRRKSSSESGSRRNAAQASRGARFYSAKTVRAKKNAPRSELADSLGDQFRFLFPFPVPGDSRNIEIYMCHARVVFADGVDENAERLINRWVVITPAPAKCAIWTGTSGAAGRTSRRKIPACFLPYGLFLVMEARM